MKYLTTKKSIIVALSLASAISCQAFTPLANSAGSTGIRAASSSMKRPLATPLMNSLQPNQDSNNNYEEKKSTDPTPALFQYLQYPAQRNGVMAGAALATALSMAPMQADAAMSGGRIGGSSFSSPSMSRSYSAPRASYSSRSYNYYSRPSYITPMPFVAPISPFYSPYSYGYGAPGVVSVGGGPGIFSIFILGGMALAASNVINSITRSGRSSSSFFQERTSDSVLGVGTSVVKLSVALDVSNRDDPNSILGVLDRLANTARTDSRMGIQNLSSQIAVELLRRKSSIAAASTEYKHFRNRDKAQREFNSLSVKERGKFEKETVSKFDGVDYSSGATASRNGFDDKATIAVVTLVLAIDGDQTKVPQIRSLNDVESALRQIASDVKVSDCLQGAEILWTPEDRSETLTFRDVIADYPELSSV